MSSNDAALPPGFPVAEPPWTLNGEVWWLPLSFFGGGGRAQPSGSFDTLETYSAQLGEDAKSFLGGMGIVMLIRYHDSPVGPYDELLVVPGQFALPEGVKKPTTGSTRYRVTRIYVSTNDSVANGRKNWNIPKHLAKFDFQRSPDGKLDVRIYASTSPSVFSDNPFFAARLTDSRFSPTLPLNTRYLPMGLDLAQPPLESSSNPAQDGLVGTKTWKYVPGVTFRGKIRLASVEGLLEGNEREGGKGKKRIADGKGFEDIKPYSSMVVHWTTCRIGFSVPGILS